MTVWENICKYSIAYWLRLAQPFIQATVWCVSMISYFNNEIEACFHRNFQILSGQCIPDAMVLLMNCFWTVEKVIKRDLWYEVCLSELTASLFFPSITIFRWSNKGDWCGTPFFNRKLREYAHRNTVRWKLVRTIFVKWMSFAFQKFAEQKGRAFYNDVHFSLLQTARTNNKVHNFILNKFQMI